MRVGRKTDPNEPCAALSWQEAPPGGLCPVPAGVAAGGLFGCSAVHPLIQWVAAPPHADYGVPQAPGYAAGLEAHHAGTQARCCAAHAWLCHHPGWWEAA